MVDIGRVGLIVVLAVGAGACSDSTASADSSAGASESGSSGADGGASATAQPGATETSADGSSSSTGASSSDDGTTGGAVPTCEPNGCSADCIWPAGIETCNDEPHAADFVACELPPLCESGSACCYMQAIRYGVVGSIALTVDNSISVPQLIAIDILGEGRVRRLETQATGTWCGPTDHFREGWVGHVPAPDDAFWGDCDPTPVATPSETPWPLYAVPVGDACDGPLTECPAETTFTLGCDATCPMATDGICDDLTGTGLCAAGCDPDDCG